MALAGIRSSSAPRRAMRRNSRRSAGPMLTGFTRSDSFLFRTRMIGSLVPGRAATKHASRRFRACRRWPRTATRAIFLPCCGRWDCAQRKPASPIFWKRVKRGPIRCSADCRSSSAPPTIWAVTVEFSRKCAAGGGSCWPTIWLLPGRKVLIWLYYLRFISSFDEAIPLVPPSNLIS